MYFLSSFDGRANFARRPKMLKSRKKGSILKSIIGKTPAGRLTRAAGLSAGALALGGVGSMASRANVERQSREARSLIKKVRQAYNT